MAHIKAAGAKAHQGVNMRGKRLGVKKSDGETVRSGNIIVKQRGTVYHPGRNVMMGRDHTIFSTAEGTVSFRRMTGAKRSQKFVDVVLEEQTSK